MLELLTAAGDVARRPLDDELGVLVHLLARLLMPGNAPGEHERLRLRARLREPALHEQDVEPLLHTPSVVLAVGASSARTAYGAQEAGESGASATERQKVKPAVYTARPSRSGPRRGARTGSSASLASVSSSVASRAS